MIAPWLTRLSLPARWRRPAIMGGSAVAHVLVLFAILPRPEPLPPVPQGPPVVFLEIEPRPLLKDEKPRQPAAPPVRPDVVQAARAGGIPLPYRFPVRRPDEDDERVPSPQAAVAAAAAQGVEAWRVRPETAEDRAAAGLRAGVGCSTMYDRLSRVEQANCDNRFRQAAMAAPPIRSSGNRDLDRRFATEGAAAMARYNSIYGPAHGGTGVVTTGDCPGSNFGTGCAGALLEDGFRQDRNDTLNEGLDRDD